MKKIEKIRINIDYVPNEHFDHQLAFKILQDKINEIIDTLQEKKK